MSCRRITYSSSELDWLREHGTKPRAEVHAGFVAKFGRTDVSIPNIKQQLLRMRVTTGRAPIVSMKFSEVELEFVEFRQLMSRKALHEAFQKRFGRPDVTVDAIQNLCSRSGWTTRTNSPAVNWSKEEIAFVEANRTLSRKDLHAAVCERFGRDDVTEENLKSLCTRRGFRTGRTGLFEKGIVPANKGKKMPFNKNCARTQFQKGCRSRTAAEAYQPIGTEVIRDGYVWRKVNDDLLLQRRWKTAQSIAWEAIHGPVPEGHVLKCLDGNRQNTDPSNWEAVHRGVLVRLNDGDRRRRLAYDDAPDELKPLIMASAKLKHAVGQTRRRRAA